LISDIVVGNITGSAIIHVAMGWVLGSVLLLAWSRQKSGHRLSSAAAHARSAPRTDDDGL
jgi:hypothetical protein